MKQLGELNKLAQDPALSDTQILAVSSELPPDLYKAYNKITENGANPADIIFLSDVGHKVIDRFGLFNPDDSRGLPHPATYLIDKKGIVRWKVINVDYRVRPTNEQILEALKLIPK